MFLNVENISTALSIKTGILGLSCLYRLSCLGPNSEPLSVAFLSRVHGNEKRWEKYLFIAMPDYLKVSLLEILGPCYFKYHYNELR